MGDFDEFWAERWQSGRIGFHEGKPNDLLVQHVARIETKPRMRIVVPLAGKAVDLAWLAARGHEVVGVEFREEAVRAFFEDRGIDATVGDIGGMPSRSAGGVTLVCGDFFAVRAEDLGTFDAAYDRAALIAVEPTAHARYVAQYRALLDENAPILLIAVTYEGDVSLGPPWSIDEAAIRTLFAGYRIELLSTRAVSVPDGLAKAGVDHMNESAYIIRAPV
jgi:thiopurine S-methyltransferase